MSLEEEIIKNPDLVKTLNQQQIKKILSKTLNVFKKENTLLEPDNNRFVFAGDTHGDFETTKAIVKNFFDKNNLVFLGDYIDREPIRWGSIYNVTYLFILKGCYPEKIYLLKGNHECNYIIPCYPYEFESEIIQRYDSSVLHDKFVETFKNMPLMLLTKNVFAAHGGIIKKANLEILRKTDKNNIAAVESLVWSDPVISPTYRGAGDRFDEEDLTSFLNEINAKVFVRGHDYNTLGFSIYNGKCLTIFSSQKYKKMGNQGVLVAIVEKQASNIKDISIKNLSNGKWIEYKTANL